MTRRRRSLAIAGIVLVAAFGKAMAGGGEAAGPAATPKEPKTVLLLHSYHPGFDWTDDLDRGIRAAFDESRYAVDVRTEYLDLKRYADAAYAERLARHLSLKYAAAHLDLVLTTDDGALAFYAHNRGRMFPAVPAVFCGVNDTAAARLVPRDVITGVVEVFSDTGILDLALRLHPGRRRVTVVGDNSPVGEATLRQFRDIAARRPDLGFSFLDGGALRLDDILASLAKLGADDLVITSAFTRDRDRVYLVLDQANRLIAGAGSAPVYSPSISRLGQGVLGGTRSTGVYHATLAAGLAVRVLGGTPPAQVPVVEDRKNLYVFDFAELERWGLDASALPPDTLVVNRPDDFYVKYRAYVWGGGIFIVFQTAVIGALIASIARRRRAEKRMGEQASILRAMNRELEAVNTTLQGEIEERHRAEAEREHLHGQLHQSQKMEAIGRLAGGVAHDFNNLLSVILGHAGLAMETLRDDDPLKRDLEQIRAAGDRAATLTRQLLAFSRKQVLQPVLVDLNRVTERVESMLRRLIGEDIELVRTSAADLGLTLADPGQIEQVLMNLAVNARDAMPAGGRLTIEMSNVVLDDAAARLAGLPQGGPFVRLAVTDSGCGMDAATRARLFEPFFTTKAPGKGTGLGLSTVYGIVQQSGGGIVVRSEPGQGSTFEILLPRQSPGSAPDGAPAAAPAAVGGTETILVVEDEDAVRNLARRVLNAAGYTVLTAPNGVEALRLCEAVQSDIQLLLTDVVMPQMGGVVLAQRLAVARPGLRVLFMSGYADQPGSEQGPLASGASFLAKPFEAAALAQKVREVLDSAAADSPPLTGRDA